MNAEVETLLDELTPPAPPAVKPRWEAVVADSGVRSRRRWTLVAITALVTAAVAAPALALRDEAVRLLGGGDVADEVQRAVQPISATPVVGYVRLRTSTGAHATLIATDRESGDRCLGLAWEGTGRAGDVALACGEAAQAPLAVGEAGRRVRGGWVALVFGRAAADVARLELVSSSGGAVAVPLSASHFLVEVPRWEGDAWLVAYGYGGLELHRHKLEVAPSWTPPDPVGERAPVLTRDMAGRTWAIFNYSATGARRCYGVDTAWASGEPPPWDRRGSQSFRCVAEAAIVSDGASLLGPDVWPSVDGSGEWVSVVAAVSARAATVRLTLENGAAVNLIPRQQTAVYLVPLRDEERPIRADVLAADGTVIANERLR